MIRRSGKDPKILQLRVTLAESEPLIWREVLVDERCTLLQLHDTLQVVFGFFNYHLFEFEIGGERYEAPDPEAEGKDATSAVLADLDLEPGKAFVYRYDFGDDWTFDVKVVTESAIGSDVPLPCVIAGERAGPLEDSGGVWRFQEMMSVLSDPAHPDYEEYKAWVDPEYDPAHFDIRATNTFLALASGWGVLSAE